jgi:hypothetical protein
MDSEDDPNGSKRLGSFWVSSTCASEPGYLRHILNSVAAVDAVHLNF